MKQRTQELECRVQALLDDPQYAGHPLREALADLTEHLGLQVERIERINTLSDAFQSMAHQRELTLYERFDRQLRRLSKIVSISDRYQSVMHDLNLAVTEASNRDPLTELLNRRALMRRLKEECDRAIEGHGFTVAMLDVDHFKLVNDSYGHETGDRALIELARVMRANVRASDTFGRWGGEEFLVLMPDTPVADARVMLNRLMDVLRLSSIDAGDHVLRLTISIGLASHRQTESLSDTLRRADAALYHAKQAGRDRLVLESLPG
jgi:diguanylate cyclase (GGDEF)-like protein